MNFDPYALGLDVEGHSGAEYKVRCPFHNDSHASASFNSDKGLFICYACGEKANSRRIAEQTNGVVVGSITTKSQEDASKDLDWTAWGRSPLALDNPYLAGRRVTNEQVRRFDIRANHTGILFPICDNTGRLVGYQMRKYSGKPKYVFHGDKADFWPYENLATNGVLYVVEGVFSVLRLDRVGLKAVAIFGTGNARRVAPYLRPKDAYALFDTDDAGLVAMGRFITSGQPGIPAILTPPNYPEPDELNPKQMARLEEYRTSSVISILRRADDFRHVKSQIFKESKHGRKV